jgi:hypothetical protein
VCHRGTVLGLEQFSRITDCPDDQQPPRASLDLRARAGLGTLQNLPATNTSAAIDPLNRP